MFFSVGLTGRRVEQKSGQINAGGGGRRVTTVSGSRLSASFVLLTAVNRSVQQLFICCSDVSSYVGKGRRRLRRGERLTIWCEEAPPPRLSAHVSASLDISRLRWFYSAFWYRWAINESTSKRSSLLPQHRWQRLGHRVHTSLTHRFILPNCDLLFVSESGITASIIWSILAFENAAVWWGLFMMRTVMCDPHNRPYGCI